MFSFCDFFSKIMKKDYTWFQSACVENSSQGLVPGFKAHLQNSCERLVYLVSKRMCRTAARALYLVPKCICRTAYRGLYLVPKRMHRTAAEGLYLVPKRICREKLLGACTWFPSACVEQLGYCFQASTSPQSQYPPPELVLILYR